MVLVLVAAALGVGWMAPDIPVLGVAAETGVEFAESMREGPGAMERASSLAEAARSKQKYYQYTDASGSVRFAKKLEDVPEQWRDRAGTVLMDGPPPANPAEARAVRAAQTARVKAPTRYRTPRLIVYSSQADENARKMLAWLDKNEIPYEKRDVDEHPRFFRELQDKTNSTNLPAYEIDGEIHRGFSVRRFKQRYAQARKVS
jgi:hypothetical protein